MRQKRLAAKVGVHEEVDLCRPATVQPAVIHTCKCKDTSVKLSSTEVGPHHRQYDSERLNNKSDAGQTPTSDGTSGKSVCVPFLTYDPLLWAVTTL